MTHLHTRRMIHVELARRVCMEGSMADYDLAKDVMRRVGRTLLMEVVKLVKRVPGDTHSPRSTELIELPNGALVIVFLIPAGMQWAPQAHKELSTRFRGSEPRGGEFHLVLEGRGTQYTGIVTEYDDDDGVECVVKEWSARMVNPWSIVAVEPNTAHVLVADERMVGLMYTWPENRPGRNAYSVSEECWPQALRKRR